MNLHRLVAALLLESKALDILVLGEFDGMLISSSIGVVLVA